MKKLILLAPVAALALIGCATSQGQGGWTTVNRTELQLDMFAPTDGGGAPEFSCRRSVSNKCHVTVVDACADTSAPCRGGASEQFVLAHYEEKELDRVGAPLFFCVSPFNAPSVDACREAQARDADGVGGVMLSSL